MRKLMMILCLLLWAGLTGCGQEYASRNPLSIQPTPTPFPAAGPLGSIYFEDFEGGLLGLFTYGDAGSSSSVAASTAAAYAGLRGVRATLTANGWGVGFGFESRGGIRNFTGTTTIKLWVRSSLPLTGVQVEWNEDGIGANEEVWHCTDQTLPAGIWTEITLTPISAFVEDAYGNPACAGTCSNAGNGNSAQDLNIVKKFQFKTSGGVSGAVVDIDEIRFL